ncbi:MAG: hypothetical protein R3D98_11335 [Candidatus Krumholzibacteriia bacterium]
MRRPIVPVRLAAAVLAYMFVMSALEPVPAIPGRVSLPDNPPPAVLHARAA